MIITTTIRTFLERSAEQNPTRNALVWYENKEWKRRNWADFLKGVREVAEGYGRSFNLKPREDNVAIILGNSPVWMESYLAQSGAGLSVAPLDPKLHNDEVEYILKDSDAAVVTTDKAHLKMMMQIAERLPRLRAIVIVDGVIFEGQKIGNAEVVEYEKLRVAGGGAWYDANRARPEDVASIIYTSGTTGKPKGAMLTHGNFVADIEGALKTFKIKITPADSLMVVLPLFHAFSFTANFLIGLMLSVEMKFIESLRTVGRDVKELKPTILMAVPLLAEKLHDKIEEGLRKSKVAQFLLKIGLRGPVMHMVKLKLGGKLRVMVTGGAPCPKHVLEGFRRLHVAFYEGYGLTECAPVVSITSFNCRKMGTIGYAIDGCEVRLADGAHRVDLRSAHADHGRALGEAVALEESDVHAVEAGEDVVRARRAACDHEAEASAETELDHVHDGSAKADLQKEARDLRALQRLVDLLVDLLGEERDGHHDGRLQRLDVLDDRPERLHEADLRADDHGAHEVRRERECVEEGQHHEERVAFGDLRAEALERADYVVEKVGVG